MIVYDGRHDRVSRDLRRGFPGRSRWPAGMPAAARHRCGMRRHIAAIDDCLSLANLNPAAALADARKLEQGGRRRAGRTLRRRWRWSSSSAMPKRRRGWTIAGGRAAWHGQSSRRAVRPGRQCLAAGGRWRARGAELFRRAGAVGRRCRSVRRSGPRPGDAQDWQRGGIWISMPRLQLSPRRADLLVLRASARRALKRYDDARADIEAALKLKPSDGDALVERGTAARAAGRYRRRAPRFPGGAEDRGSAARPPTRRARPGESGRDRSSP